MTPIHDGVLDKKSYAGPLVEHRINKMYAAGSLENMDKKSYAGPLVEHRINKMYAAGSLENFYFDFESVITTLSLTINLFFFFFGEKSWILIQVSFYILNLKN